MAITFIAFIECVFRPRISWSVVYGFPYLEEPTTDGLYKAITDGAEVALVDIKNDRRYFSFKDEGEVRVVGNTIVFDDEWAEELAINESKQFPKKPAIDD